MHMKSRLTRGTKEKQNTLKESDQFKLGEWVLAAVEQTEWTIGNAGDVAVHTPAPAEEAVNAVLARTASSARLLYGAAPNAMGRSWVVDTGASMNALPKELFVGRNSKRHTTNVVRRARARHRLPRGTSAAPDGSRQRGRNDRCVSSSWAPMYDCRSASGVE